MKSLTFPLVGTKEEELIEKTLVKKP